MRQEGLVRVDSSCGRILLFDSGLLTAKTTKDTQGVQVMTLKKGAHVCAAQVYEPGSLEEEHRYQAAALPSRGGIPKAPQQLSLESL